jgi:hypothetical protein
MLESATPLMHLLWLVPLLLLIIYVGSPRHRGTMGEDRIDRLLGAALPRSRYVRFKGLVIPSGGGSRRIPHLVISEFGIFVIQPVHRPGRITGARAQDQWSQRQWGRSHRFDNPMHQGDLHVDALKRLLDFTGLSFHSLVVFTSESHFTGESPENVIPVDKLIPLIRRQGRKLIEAEACQRALKVLNDYRLDRPRRFVPDKWTLTRWGLIAMLVAGAWIAFEKELRIAHDSIQGQLGQLRSPDEFHPDGRKKSEQELWESSLLCAYSIDTGRCACYDRDGQPAELHPARCRDLAEKDSILKR